MIKGGPKIINDGLVLCLDAHDAKSYAGEPTTNLLGSNDNPLNGMSGISLTKIETQADGWIKYSMSGTFTGGTYPYIAYIDGVSFTGGTAYTSRAMIKTNVESKFNYFGTSSINYVNQPKDAEGTGRSIVTEENGFNVYTVSREGFIYTSTTTQVGYLFTNPINNTTFNSSTDFMWIKNVQVEQKTYPTPWTYTSRSATNGWIDRTGNSTGGTLTNMVGTGASHYRDGQVIMPVSASYLDFDGTNDYVLTNFTPSSDDVKTISVWIYWDATSGGNGFEYIVGMDFSDANNGHVPVSITSSGQFRFRQQSSSLSIDQTIYTDAYVSTGEWTNLVISSDGSAFSFYKNGVKASISSGTNNGKWFSFLSGPIMIGSSDWVSLQNYDYFNGKIANVTIYNKQLTDAEVLSNYNATKERF